MQEAFSSFRGPSLSRDYIGGMFRTGRPPKQKRTAFGERLCHARERMGLTQGELAEKMGTVQQVVAAWERYPYALKPEQLRALAEALKVSTDYLLGISSGPQIKGPAGKMRQLFEAASRLPRSQQQKVADILAPFIKEHSLSAS